ncbi:MAG: AraC family transcriptional regulator [Bacteroidota bacterium]
MNDNIRFAALAFMVLVIALLAVKKNKQQPDYILLLWCGLFLGHLLVLNFQASLPDLYFFANEVVGYFHGLLLYYYLSSIKDELPKLKTIGWQVGAILVISSLPILILGETYWLYIPIFIALKTIVNLFFIGKVSLKLMNRTFPSELWTLFLTSSLLVVLLLPTVLAVIDIDRFITSQNVIGNALYCLFVFALGFIGIGVRPIFISKEKPDASTLSTPTVKYNSSNLTPNQRTVIYQKLEELVQKEQLYATPNLTLQQLSERLGYNVNNISESINENAEGNFNDYINQKRIDAFKQKVAAGEHEYKKLLALAFECGFNSKSSFNRAFKKYEQLTPTQYIRLKLPSDTSTSS